MCVYIYIYIYTDAHVHIETQTLQCRVCSVTIIFVLLSGYGDLKIYNLVQH